MGYKSDTADNRTGNVRITYQVAHSGKHCCYGNTIMLSLYIVVDLLVAINNVKPLRVAMETQEWGFPCAAVKYKTSPTAVKSTDVLRSSRITSDTFVLL